MRRLLISAVTSLCLCSQAVAQDKTRSEAIMYGFVPDVSQLEQIKGDDLKTRLRGKTIAGIYGITMHDDQRYTEDFHADGRMDYRERDFSSTGRWFVKNDKLCFAYSERRGAPFCFYEFAYGSCVISYSDTTPLRAGKPVGVEDWASVQVFVDDDFEWPETPTKDDALSCQFSMV
jgi:hypothetical protein